MTTRRAALLAGQLVMRVVSIVTLTQPESLLGPWPGHALYLLFISYLLSDTKTGYCPQLCSDDDDGTSNSNRLK